MGKRKRKNTGDPRTASWKRYKKQATETAEDILLSIVRNGDSYDDFDDYEESVLDFTWDAVMEEKENGT